MATTQTSYGVISIGERAAESEDDRGYIRLRADLDIAAFGASAAYQKKAGEVLIREHDEIGPGADGHEELYVVVQGTARFTVDGDDVEAPQGTAVFVRNPAFSAAMAFSFSASGAARSLSRNAMRLACSDARS